MSMFAETIGAEHEYRHTPDDDPAYNESTYYNFGCPDSGIVGWLRVAVQPNQPAGQASVLLFLPDGQTLFAHQRTTSISSDALAVGDLSFEIVEPHRRQQLNFDGPLFSFPEPRLLDRPKEAFAQATEHRASIRLAVTGNGAPFGSDGEEPANILEATMAVGHYEQFILVEGEVVLDGRRLAVRGGGLRDHSWGPRDWAGPLFYRWVTAAFPDHSAIMALDVARRDGTRTRRAAAVADGVAAPAELTGLTVEWAEDGFCRTAICHLRTGDGPLTLTATVRRPERFAPLRHRRTAPDGTELRTRIGYSAYEFVTSDGRRGAGVVEALDQLVDGLPIGMRDAGEASA